MDWNSSRVLCCIQKWLTLRIRYSSFSIFLTLMNKIHSFPMTLSSCFWAVVHSLTKYMGWEVSWTKFGYNNMWGASFLMGKLRSMWANYSNGPNQLRISRCSSKKFSKGLLQIIRQFYPTRYISKPLLNLIKSNSIHLLMR